MSFPLEYLCNQTLTFLNLPWKESMGIQFGTSFIIGKVVKLNSKENIMYFVNETLLYGTKTMHQEIVHRLPKLCLFCSNVNILVFLQTNSFPIMLFGLDAGITTHFLFLPCGLYHALDCSQESSSLFKYFTQFQFEINLFNLIIKFISFINIQFQSLW